MKNIELEDYDTIQNKFLSLQQELKRVTSWDKEQDILKEMAQLLKRRKELANGNG